MDSLRLSSADGAVSHREQVPERYGLTWVGKAEAARAATRGNTATLLPLPDLSVRWEEAEHAVVEGDNLDVLKCLRHGYRGRVRMVYIDPPYNTGRDFIYRDNFRDTVGEYLRRTGHADGEGSDHPAAPEIQGRFHSRWLSMMYPRLILARELLADDGFIAVSIGEEEVAGLRLLMNEVFGEENHRNTLAVRRHDKNLTRQFMARGLTSLAVGFEYVLVYARAPAAVINPVFREASLKRQAHGYWKGFWNAADRPTMRYPLCGVEPKTGQWKWKREVAEEALHNFEEYQTHYADRFSLEEHWENTGRGKRFLRHKKAGRGKNAGVEHWVAPSSGILRTSNWTDRLASESIRGMGLPFDSPKHTELIASLLRMCSAEDALVLDFFAGSGTTAQAVLRVNREDGWRQRFLLVQLPEPVEHPGFETIADVTRARVRLALAEDAVPDEGFRAFRLATSNFRLWSAEPTGSAAGMEQLHRDMEPLLPGRGTEDVLWELLLKAGVPLGAAVERLECAGRTVFAALERALLICLADTIDESLLDAMRSLHPQRILCLDYGFRGDDAARRRAKERLAANGVVLQLVQQSETWRPLCNR